MVKNFFLFIKKIFARRPAWLFLNAALALLAVVLSIKAASLVIGHYNARPKALPAANNFSAKPSQPAKTAASQRLNQARRRLDGVYVDKESANLWPVAVMIDNHPQARPPAGLALANLVFEAPVEGKITRLMAVYSLDHEIDKIGPIRSARPYFLDWALGLKALYVHCGGSPQALARIKQAGVLDLNEFYRGRYFWRATNRSAPHNVYISSASLKAYLKKLGLGAAEFSPWPYQDSLEPRPATTSNIIINYGADDFVVQWKYDKINNRYLRYQAGQPAKDEDGSWLSAKNIAIAQIEKRVIDEVGRLSLKTIGQGPALFCQQGACQSGFWRQSRPAERLRFYRQDGQEFVFLPGPTWVEIVPNLAIVSQSQ